uniref:Uncharacterized protein n=1 Tax=Oryza glumipatula TaxID=40148 RepID=A0A0E0AB64_9ORYZ
MNRGRRDRPSPPPHLANYRRRGGRASPGARRRRAPPTTPRRFLEQTLAIRKMMDRTLNQVDELMLLFRGLNYRRISIVERQYTQRICFFLDTRYPGAEVIIGADTLALL